MTRKRDRIEELIEAERWVDARKAILEELAHDEENHWLLTRLSTTYYEQGDYEEALKWAERARQLAPECPLVLWDFAGALDMLGRERDALEVYRALIARGPEMLQEDECSEGPDWVLGLLADCVYRAARCMEDLGQKKKARALYQLYLELADSGAQSIYPREDAAVGLRRVTPKPTLLRRRNEVLSRASDELAGV